MNRSKIVGATVACCLSPVFAEGLPEGYVPVEYVFTDGGQYLNTEYYPGPDTIIEGDVQMVGSFMPNANYAPFGVIESKRYFSVNYGDADRILVWGGPTGQAVEDVKGASAVNGRRVKIRFDAPARTFAYGDVIRSGCTVPTSTFTELPIAICGQNRYDKGPVPFSGFNMRVYGWKIYTGEKLERDYVPCMRVADSVYGLYDRERTLFCPSDGTPFASGYVVAKVTCLGQGTVSVMKDGTDVTGIPLELETKVVCVARPAAGYKIAGWFGDGVPNGYSTEPSLALETSAKGVTAVFIRKDRVVPGGYTRLEYVETTGGQAVDTGYYPGPRTSMDAEIGMYGDFAANANMSFYGACEDGGVRFSANFNRDTKDTILPWFGPDAANGGTPRPVSGVTSSLGCLTRLTVDAGWRKFAFGRVLQADSTPCTKRFTRATLFLGGETNATAQAVNYFNAFKMRICTWRICEGDFSRGVTLRDYVACRREADGAVGLYDLAFGEFVVPNGTEPLVAGADWSGHEHETVLAFPGKSGSDNVAVDWRPSLGSFSAAVWVRNVKPGQLGPSAQWRNGVIVAQGAMSLHNGFCCAVLSPDQLNTCSLQFQIRTDSSTLNSCSIDWTAQMSDDTWHLLTVTHDQSTGASCLYVDAKLKGSFTQMTAMPISTMPLCFGALDVTQANGEKKQQYPVQGSLAEISLWNCPLSESAVRRLLYRPLTGGEKGLVGCWSLGGRLIGDRVANGNAPHSAYADGNVVPVDGAVRYWKAPGLVLSVR